MKRLKLWYKRLNEFLDGDKWRQCKPPTAAERRAQWQIRRGRALAEEELKKEMELQEFNAVVEVQEARPIKRTRLKLVRKA